MRAAALQEQYPLHLAAFIGLPLPRDLIQEHRNQVIPEQVANQLQCLLEGPDYRMVLAGESVLHCLCWRRQEKPIIHLLSFYDVDVNIIRRCWTNSITHLDQAHVKNGRPVFPNDGGSWRQPRSV